jgi:phosphate transport system substrate-binding protein
MNQRLVAVVGLIAGLFLAVWAPLPEAQEKKVVRVKGSNVMAGPVDELAKAFAKSNPDFTVVVSGGGTVVGLDALLVHRTGEVAMASRKLFPKEIQTAAVEGLKIVEIPFGWDGVAVIAHPSNPINELTIDQVKNIFSGDYSSWNQAGGPQVPITLYVVEEQWSGLSGFFRDQVLKEAAFAPASNMKQYIDHVIRFVSLSKEAIGIAPLAKAYPAQSANKVKIIALRKDQNSPPVTASPTTVADRSYPWATPLILFYIDSPAGRHVKQFVDFCVKKGAGNK